MILNIVCCKPKGTLTITLHLRTYSETELLQANAIEILCFMKSVTN